MESTLKGIGGCDAPSVLDMVGGVGDTYGEVCATEDQLVTPWTISAPRSARKHFDFSN
jgi:malate dehydrogenase (oxaloacetate-decarboxylating)(NADP+)